MERGAWWAIGHGVKRDGHDLVTKPPPPSMFRVNIQGTSLFIFYIPWNWEHLKK